MTGAPPDPPPASPAERPRWRRRLLNRFVLVPGALALAVALWNVYVGLHDHGLVAGRVADAAGQPVADATVVLWVLNFTTYVEKSRTTTGPDGRFVIRDNDSHNIQIAAEKPGVGRSTRIPVRLYFRAEDIILRDPLVLGGG
jgi:Carboxypeptidase regulatory-like domain